MLICYLYISELNSICKEIKGIQKCCLRHSNILFTLFTVAIDLIVQHIQELLRPSANKIGNKRPRYNSDSFVGRPH